MKGFVFVGDSHKVIKNFPKEAREDILYLLESLGVGVDLSPKSFKSMPSVGKGAYELRVKTDKQYRVFYVVKFIEANYILHAFIKKTQKTPKKEIEMGKKRYKSLLQSRNEIEK